MIGTTPCVGKIGPGSRHPSVRNLELDLNALDAWGYQCVITLMELNDLIDYQPRNLAARARARYGESSWTPADRRRQDTGSTGWGARGLSPTRYSSLLASPEWRS